MGTNKFLVIGAAFNYNWNDIKYWVNSLKRTGYDGDVVLVISGVDESTKSKLDENGVITIQSRETIGFAPHVARFISIADYIRNNIDKYDKVLVTDTRDIIFQSDPSKNNFASPLNEKAMFCSSEGLVYAAEPWGMNNILQAFGDLSCLLWDKKICNVGVIMGTPAIVANVLDKIPFIAKGLPIPITDQAVYNMIINSGEYYRDSVVLDNSDAWSINLGTTIQAVDAGFGDLGQLARMFPKNRETYLKNYLDEQPVIKDDGVVLNTKGNKFCVVHQYDRVPNLKEMVQKMYDDQ